MRLYVDGANGRASEALEPGLRYSGVLGKLGEQGDRENLGGVVGNGLTGLECDTSPLVMAHARSQQGKIGERRIRGAGGQHESRGHRFGFPHLVAVRFHEPIVRHGFGHVYGTVTLGLCSICT